MANKKEHNIKNTKVNKIRRIEKELKTNPNNTSAKNALEFWKSHDRKVKNGRK